jgi:DNA polymerase-4
MDAFFASIEQHDRPELRGLPIIIGSDSRRGVVATASYEARKFGVHSAQPMAIAKQKCPEGIIVYPRFERYSQVSKQIMAIFEEFSPTIEPLSIDEAFLDMTGTQAMGTPLELAKALQQRIFEATGLTCSIGIAHNKFLAKLSSDLKKPNGITMVPDGQEKDFIAPLPVRKLWGVGPKSEAKIRELGIETIGDVAEADLTRLREQLGRSMADHIYTLAHAIDHRQISPDRERKSIGSETTFDVDIRTQDQVANALRPHADDVARTLRKRI